MSWELLRKRLNEHSSALTSTLEHGFLPEDRMFVAGALLSRLDFLKATTKDSSPLAAVLNDVVLKLRLDTRGQKLIDAAAHLHGAFLAQHRAGHKQSALASAFQTAIHQGKISNIEQLEAAAQEIELETEEKKLGEKILAKRFGLRLE
ncbi:MAG TPA: hypothetical protein VGQ00_02625 [Candidatus Norongarragalinales archaeon]|jgi:hypothetical protein|nr:hypothetical protein [Candidatus Norongarragalinales archaeon]